MNGRKKRILWLASWYPHRGDPFDGDFIQRHARAAAISHEIHLIYVGEAETSGPVEEELNQATGLTEQLIYFRGPSGVAARLARQWRWRGCFQKAIRAYVEAHGKPDLVHVHVPWKAGLMAAWMKKKYGIPYIVSEHWGIYDPSAADHISRWPYLSRKLLLALWRQASAFVSVSRFLAGRIEEATQRKCDAIIPNVVDTTLFFHRDEKYSKFTFIHVSNMVPLKNAGLIIEAFHQLRKNQMDAQLIMIGNRDDLYPRQAAAYGLLNQSVFFRGEIAYVEVAEEVRRAHCLVLFSQSETFSCVTAEALCAGLPVIASRAGALPELVDATNGILVSPGDIAALVSAMEEMVSGYGNYDPARISAAAAGRFGYAPVSQAFEELYSARW